MTHSYNKLANLNLIPFVQLFVRLCSIAVFRFLTDIENKLFLRANHSITVKNIYGHKRVPYISIFIRLDES